MPDPQQFDPSKPFTVQSASPAVSGFDPSKPFTVTASAPAQAPSLVDTIEDRLVGAGKRVARLWQQIGNVPKVVGLPGLAEVTDKTFGLPPGTSWQATEPTTPGQKQVGQYITNLATTVGLGAAGELAGAGAGLELGRAAEDAGTTIQKTVDVANKAKASAPVRILLRGHPIQALSAAAARVGASLSAKGLESFGQLLSQDPDAAGKLAQVADTATSGGLTLNSTQGDFVLNMIEQLNSGRALTGGQRAYINAIFRAMPKP